jgi:Tfp pilus assembly protein PilF
VRAEDPAALIRRAQEHYSLGRVSEARADFEAALRLQPGHAPAWMMLGLVQYAQGRFEEAVASHARAAELRPAFPEAHASRGSALAALGRWDEAAAAFERAIEIDPRHANAYSNLGLVHQERGHADAARASFERALALDPRHAEAIHNLGYLLEDEGRWDEAMALYARALERDPGLARAAYNLGIAHLRRHEFARGWELAEARFDTVPPMTPRRFTAVPQLTAADWGGGHRVALWTEQGVGDQLVHSTLLPELEARGQDFVAEVDARLAPAFARAHPGWRIATSATSAAAFTGCDRQLALGSLPRLLRPDLASFEAQPRALLVADAARAATYRGRFPRDARVVGISWRSFQSGARARVARDKSAPLAAFSALAKRADLRLLDLQYGETKAEREAFARAGASLAHFDDLDLFADLDGVLAAIAACDAVVTTSNVTAHLAGALGKRTLLVYLRAAPPFHYWAPGPSDRSPWYPSVEVVSGAGIDTWEKALARADELLAR